MRNTVIGLALALLFLSGLFALPRFFSHRHVEMPSAQLVGIEPGFSGARRVGPWTLACGSARKKAVPLPFSFGPAKPTAADTQDMGRCRAFIAFRREGDSRQVALLLSFRLVGRAQRLAMLVHIPSAAKKGSAILFRLGTTAINLPVSTCEKGSCLAMRVLAPRQEPMFYGAGMGKLVLPAGPNGKQRAARVPLRGLRSIVSAMRRAQIGD